MPTARERLEYLRGLKAQQGAAETPRQKLERLRAAKSQQVQAIPPEQRAQQLMKELPADVPLPEGFEQFDTRGVKVEQPDYSLGEQIVGAGETALTAITGATGGMAGQIYGTGKGLVDVVSSGQYGTPQGARAVQEEAMKQAGEFTYQPRTPAGQEFTQELGELAAPLQAIPSVQGELTALAQFAKPVLRQASVEIPRIGKRMVKDMVADDLKAARANPELGNRIRQIGIAVDAGDIDPKQLPVVLKDIQGEVVSKAGAGTFEKLSQMADDIAAGGEASAKDIIRLGSDVGQAAANKKLVKYMLDGAEKSAKDPAAINAARQGFDPGVVTAVKGSTAADKSKMNKMLNMMKEITENKRKAYDMRPSDVAGDSLLQRYKDVSRVNRSAGNKLDSVAKNLKGKYADFNQPINNFLNKLDDMGIQIGDDLKPNFKGSDIEGFKPAEFAVNKIVNRLKAGERGQKPTAYDMHRLKRFIDNNVDYGVEGTGLTGDVQRVVKGLRREIDNVLDDNFDEYNKVNTQYSDTIRVLKDLQEVAGTKLDLEGAGAESAIGTKLRTLMSNNQSRVNMKNAIERLQETAEKYGSKYNDDIGMQMLFADELDARFSPVARTSLGGELQKQSQAITRGLSEQAMSSEGLTKGAVKAPFRAAAKGFKKGQEFILGDEEQRAFNAMQELLKRRD